MAAHSFAGFWQPKTFSLSEKFFKNPKMETANQNLPLPEPEVVDEPWLDAPKNTRRFRQGVNNHLPNALFNDIDPTHFLVKERPVHRTIQRMSVEGYTNREISGFVGRSEGYVSNVLRQPFSRENMIQEVKDTIQDDVKKFLEGEVLPTLHTLRDIRDDPAAKRSERIAAGTYLIDRFLGRPNQPFTQETTDAKKLTTEELERRVASLVGGVSETPPASKES